MITKHPLTLALTLGIWCICMVPLPETPLDKVSFVDKYTHFVLFGTLCTLAWIEGYWRKKQHNFNTDVLLYAVVPFAMGGLIEVAQATLTGGVRSGDWWDWLADGVGVAIGQLIGIPLALRLAKWRKAR